MNEFDSGDEFAVYDTSANTTGKMTIANVLGTSITGLGTTATTIPGAISELNTGLGSVNTLLGSGDISSIGDGSVTGAISSLNNDLIDLNNKTTGSGTSSNQYGECTYSWIAKAGIVMVYFTYTPNQNITNSSGQLYISNAPLPAINVYGSTTDPEVSGTVLGPVQLRPDRTIYFNGPRTANHVYQGSVTYVAN